MQDRPKFAIQLGMEFLDAHVEKKLLGGKFVKTGPLLAVAGFLFQTGALLGRAFRERLDLFANPYTFVPSAKIREEGLRVAQVGRSATTFHEMVIMHAMSTESPREPSTWPQWLRSHAGDKVPLEPAGFAVHMFAVRGVGLADHSPGRVEELYAGSYGNIDSESWNEAFKYGAVDSPSPPQYAPLEEREREAVDGFAQFCREFYPELVRPLGLP